MAHETLRKIIVNYIPIVAVAAYMGLGFWIANNQERIGGFLEEKIQKAQAVYERYEPTLKIIESAYGIAAMCAFGVWDPNFEPYKPNKNSDE